MLITSAKRSQTIYISVPINDPEESAADAREVPSAMTVAVRKNGDSTALTTTVGTLGTVTKVSFTLPSSGNTNGDIYELVADITLSSGLRQQNTIARITLLSEKVYDSLVAGTDQLLTDIFAVKGVSVSSIADFKATTTVSSNMRGTDGANTTTPNTVVPDNTGIADIKAKTDNLPSDPATVTLQTAINALIAKINEQANIIYTNTYPAITDDDRLPRYVERFFAPSLESITADCSGVAYSPKTHTVFLIQNSTTATSYIDEFTLSGKHLRRITTTGFSDTEGICWMYDDTFALCNERIPHNIYYFEIVDGDTAIDVADATAVTPSISVTLNKGMEGLTWDDKNQQWYVAIEKQSDGSDGGRVVTVELDGTTTTHPALGIALSNAGYTDLADITYDRANGRVLLLSQEQEMIIEASLDGTLYTTKSVSHYSQPEGICLSPDGQMLFLAGEPDQYGFYVYDRVDPIQERTDNLPASPAAVGSQMDLVDAPNATAVGAFRSGLALALDLATVDTNVDNIQLVTDILNAMIEDVGGDRFTALALGQAPSGSGTSPWDDDSMNAVLTALAQIGSGDIAIGPPVVDNKILDLTRGDDYKIAGGNPISFGYKNLPDLTGASAIFVAVNTGTKTEKLIIASATFQDAGEAEQFIKFELDSSESSKLLLGTASYKFNVITTFASGYRRVVTRGPMTVNEDYTI